jgi:molybdopterin/thiamine biosynthesis adenylyltransferase
MTGRNIGFVSEGEQRLLHGGSVFIAGVGGMGGAAVQSLARAGVGHFAIADIDRFEISNLNRQVFATLDNIGANKVETTRSAIASINPDATVTTFGADWLERLDEILVDNKVVINGMDDIAAGIMLYRKAREHRATVIDAFISPLPSVVVVSPDAPRPEERLHFPSLGREVSSLSRADLDRCREAEVLYVMSSSSSVNHIDMNVAAELLAGTRARPSFAPMVIITGNLMAIEALQLLLGRASTVDHRGAFFNPWTFEVVRPRNVASQWLRMRIAKRVMRSMTPP